MAVSTGRTPLGLTILGPFGHHFGVASTKEDVDALVMCIKELVVAESARDAEQAQVQDKDFQKVLMGSYFG
eukprot:gnl/Chilomastix_caulleri/4521.p3 GENE.gnl/Chilomastix_caulleri/4521~~gnl/Chilomastix_caulleri/4521.p3  ORF type:complete len:71 (+),score=16.51 gnl/Chilomastix_caulleri/4521:109-321(+)